MPTVGFAVPSLDPGGNRTSALRWARILRALGWHAFVEEGWSGRPCDLLVALHAGKSRDVIERFRGAHPGRPVVVAATGTDLYVDMQESTDAARRAREGFALADRIVLLQERARSGLPAELRDRAVVIHQSLPSPEERPEPDPDVFEVAVLANLRAVKDPLLAARATRRLPAESRIRVLHLGASVDAALEVRAIEESRANPRWSWLGARPRREALCVLARSRLTVSTSRAEGGANVVTEALALDVPVLATAVPGSVGLLGEDHPGLFPAGDVGALAALLARAEREPAFLAALRDAGRARSWIADPERERAAWASLLAGLPTAEAPR